MDTKGATAKYQRCLVFAGGGFRLGYYLGVHAAAEESGCAPDVLLASCGGALAAAVVAGLPDAAARRDWMAGPAMYDYLAGMTSSRHATPLKTVGGAAGRWLRRAPAQRIPDLWQDYLFESPAVVPLPVTPPADAPALVIVGARVLFAPGDAGLPRSGRRLFAQVAFCGPRAAGLLAALPAPAADPRWSAGAIDQQMEVDSTMALADAVRISTADVFYFRSRAHGGRHYTGGLIDLFPIELAQRLAHHVCMERKTPFNRLLALPALRAVFGIEGAARLDHVHAQHADAWFDTSSVNQSLRTHGIGKRIDWRRNRIALALPATHAAFAAQVRTQWDFGYRAGMAAFA
jgi:hypothetical protein